MATLTPADILRISEPVEAIYSRTVDELLINIAKHFKISGWERTRYWEIKKLSEMGALTEESVQIIAKNTGMLPDEIRTAFLQVSEKACLQIDPQLKAAAQQGLLQDPGTTGATSPLIRSTVQAYTDEAIDKMNMVNTTLLQSTRQAYLQGITTAVAEAQLIEAQQILDTQALAVSLGQETRVRAIRKAMDQMSAAGLTGFVDKAGRNWSPEAYSAMVVRTASHNVAIRTIKDRQQEFGGGDIFQVSSHPGARPLCYPYQGKFYSWSAGPGEFPDGDGHMRHYENITATSYGQPAGLFGINCGHHPIPMIPGYSYPQDGPTQDKEANDEEYRQSQIQRQYERNIRIAKREREIAAATGDKEAEKKASQRVLQEQSRMRGFIKETGRARRYDREQIADGSRPRPIIIKPEKQTPVKRGVNLDAIQGLSDTAKRGLENVLDKSDHKDVGALFGKFADRLVCKDDNYKGRAHYSNISGGVFFNAAKDEKGGPYDAPWEVAVHEFSHMIDSLIGKDQGKPLYRSNMDVNGKGLLNTIRSDFKAFKKSQGLSKATDVIDKLKNEGLSEKAKGNISDILEKCTGKSYPLGVGHGVSYHRGAHATEREFFAEVLDSAATNPESYEQMVRLFPNAVQMVWDMVSEAIL